MSCSRKLTLGLLLPAILLAGSGTAPLWPGARYTVADRDVAIERGLEVIYRIASDPKNFAQYGSDLVWCLYTISATAKNPKLREMARKMGHERALEWRRIHTTVPADASADEVADLVYGSNAAYRLGARDPAMEEHLRQAAARYSVVDFLRFDAAREPPPSDLPKECSKCNRGNVRGATVCRYCGEPLKMRNRYDVWCDALTTTYSGDVSGITLGAPYRDVIRWIAVMRPYRAQAALDLPDFYDVTYAITHVIYTLNDYQMYRLSPAWLQPEYQFLKTNFGEIIELEDPETLGEFLDTLRSFGMKESDALIRTGIEYMLSKQNADGSWGEAEDTVYDRYHSTWTAVDGLRQYAWHGKGLSFPGLENLIRVSYPNGLRARPFGPRGAQTSRWRHGGVPHPVGLAE